MSGHADACGRSIGHWSGRCPSTERVRWGPPSGVIVRSHHRGIDAWRSWAGHPGCLVGRLYGPAMDTARADRLSTHSGVSAVALITGECGHDRQWTRWRSWTWPSGAVSAADTTVRTPGRSTAVWPTAGTAAVRPDSDGGHELGRRVRPSVQSGCHADGAGQRVSQPTACVRGGPSGTDATGTRSARPARMNLARAWQRWAPARPEGEAGPR